MPTGTFLINFFLSLMTFNNKLIKLVGVGCTTVLNSAEAALAAAKILSLEDHIIFGRILFTQLHNVGKVFVRWFLKAMIKENKTIKKF